MSTTTETADPIVDAIEAECEIVKLPEDSEEYELDARIRCDHSATVGSEYTAGGKTGITCGSQSYIKATLKSGGQLFFCKHHGDKVESALKPISKQWYTEEARLIENRKTGSEN